MTSKKQDAGFERREQSADRRHRAPRRRGRGRRQPWPASFPRRSARHRQVCARPPRPQAASRSGGPSRRKRHHCQRDQPRVDPTVPRPAEAPGHGHRQASEGGEGRATSAVRPGRPRSRSATPGRRHVDLPLNVDEVKTVTSGRRLVTAPRELGCAECWRTPSSAAAVQDAPVCDHWARISGCALRRQSRVPSGDG
jgi:hypothetical protein